VIDGGVDGSDEAGNTHRLIDFNARPDSLSSIIGIHQAEAFV